MIGNLESSTKATLDRASAAAVVEHLDRICSHFGDGRWLGVRNVYRTSPVVALSDRKPGTGRDRPLQLGDYVAASCPLHLWDGWNYLGLAIHSHICGAVNNSKHLAYYAELRAAMSLLASQGIGVFRNRHCVVEAPGSVSYVGGNGTHAAARLYLENWTESKAATELLQRMLRMERESIDEWIKHLRQAGAWQPLGVDLLKQAGLDLRRMSVDRDARNEATYRPSGIVPLEDRNATVDAEFLVDVVALLEPGGSAEAFETLDRFLCRRLVERAYQTGTGMTVLQHYEPYENAIGAMVSEFVDQPMHQDKLERFLTRQQQPSDPAVLVAAERDGSQFDPDYHLQIIGRAMLLLRVATGAVRELFYTANLELQSLEFWWQNAGLMQGYWPASPERLDRSEIWADVSAGLDDIDQWCQSGDDSRHGLLSTCADSVLAATGMARFALIGLAS